MFKSKSNSNRTGVRYDSYTFSSKGRIGRSEAERMPALIPGKDLLGVRLKRNPCRGEARVSALFTTRDWSESNR
jgi:hypothetical protein